MTPQTTGSKKQSMTPKEKYEALETKREKLIQEYQHLYARIDSLRVKMNLIEQETQEAYKKFLMSKK